MAKEFWTSEEAFEAFQNITDTFTAADGGVKFTKFMVAMREFDKRADNDHAASQLVDVMLRFSRLIDITTQEVD